MKTKLFFLITLFLLAAVVHAAIDPQVHTTLEDQEEVPIIIVLEDNLVSASSQINVQTAAHEIEARAFADLTIQDGSSEVTSNATIEITEGNDLSISHHHTSFLGVSGIVTKEGLEKLEASPYVRDVFYDKPLSIALDVTPIQIQSNLVYPIQVNGINITGVGQTVCIVDTGIDYTHPDLGGCTNASFLAGECSPVIGGYDVADDDSDPRDFQGHGTHVAGIIVSQNLTYRGIAPGAKVVAVKVFSNDSGQTLSSTVIAGIEWCTNQNNVDRYNISVISLSLGSSSNRWQNYCDPNLSFFADPINDAVSKNISVLIASGNDGWTDGISTPACIESAIPIGAVTKSDIISSFTNRGTILNLLAPGSSIRSTYVSNSFVTLSGTSMATPHASATAVLLQQFSKLLYQKDLTPDELEATLEDTGDLIFDASSNKDYARINVYEALISLDHIAPSISLLNPTPNDSAQLLGSEVYINVSFSENVQDVTLEWDLVNETSSYPGTSFLFTKSNLTEGLHTYRVYAQDYADNINSTLIQTITILSNISNNLSNVSDSLPIINLTTPLNQSFYTHSFLLNVSLTSLDNLTSFVYTITNSTADSVYTNSIANLSSTFYQYEELINLSAIADGNYTLSILVNDSFGNGSSKQLMFIVDKTAPLFEGLDNLPLSSSTITSINFSVNVSDQNLNTTAVLFELNVSGSFLSYIMNHSEEQKYTITLLSENLSSHKNISYRFSAKDYAQNVNTTSLFSFAIQNRAPQNLTLTSLSGSVLEIGDVNSFSASAQDLDSDSLQYSWRFNDTSAATILGQSVTHQFNSTGSALIFANVTDGFNQTNTSLTVFVNDTKAPLFLSVIFDSQLHIQQEGSEQNIVVRTTDYSGLRNVTLKLNNTLQSTQCHNSSFSLTCTFTLNNLPIGSYNFTINATDNFTTRHSNTTSSTFRIFSCSDGLQNGNEGGVDCGGSCADACSSSSDSSGSSAGSSGGGGGGSSSSSTSTPSDSQVQTESLSQTGEQASKEASESVASDLREAKENLENQLTGAITADSEGNETSSFFLTGAAIFHDLQEVVFDRKVLIGFVILVVVVVSILGGLYFYRKRKHYQFRYEM